MLRIVMSLAVLSIFLFLSVRFLYAAHFISCHSRRQPRLLATHRQVLNNPMIQSAFLKPSSRRQLSRAAIGYKRICEFDICKGSAIFRELLFSLYVFLNFWLPASLRFPAFLLLCFSASLLFCFSAFLLFPASLLLRCSAFPCLFASLRFLLFFIINKP